MKPRTFGFLVVVLVGLLFSSCAVFHRRVAISCPAPAGAAELKITQNIVPPGKCGRPLHRPMRPTFITIHSTDNTSRSADALHHALAMNKGAPTLMHQSTTHVYEVRPRRDKRGVDLVSDVLPFGRL